MPLWRPYLTMLDSHSPTSPTPAPRAMPADHRRALTRTLVPESTPWTHLDVYAWNDSDKPGRPRGGEAQGLRAHFEFLRRRYS